MFSKSTTPEGLAALSARESPEIPSARGRLPFGTPVSGGVRGFPQARRMAGRSATRHPPFAIRPTQSCAVSAVASAVDAPGGAAAGMSGRRAVRWLGPHRESPGASAPMRDGPECAGEIRLECCKNATTRRRWRRRLRSARIRRARREDAWLRGGRPEMRRGAAWQGRNRRPDRRAGLPRQRWKGHSAPAAGGPG